MRNLRPARYLLYSVCLLVLTSGCQVLYHYRPVAVQVRDAETKKPIANADVHLSYPMMRDSLAPYDSSYRTGEDGLAHLRAAPYGDFGIQVDASAPDYLPEELNISTELIQRVDPPRLFENVEQRRAEFVVEMYHVPRFGVVLVVPNGYHGLIKAHVQVQDDAPSVPGQRSFRFDVSNDNTVLVKGPKVMGRVYPSDYSACYADGTPVGSEMTLTKVGFRWLSGEGKEHCFVVGTKPEYDMYRRTLPDEKPTSVRRLSSAGGKGGRGGRHHRAEGDSDW
jgi:hypothetical protein